MPQKQMSSPAMNAPRGQKHRGTDNTEHCINVFSVSSEPPCLPFPSVGAPHWWQSLLLSPCLMDEPIIGPLFAVIVALPGEKIISRPEHLAG